MTLADVYSPGRFGLSFELFPPKTEAGDRALAQNVAELMEFEPSYVTCTYGAGGSTRDKTLDVVQDVKRRFDCPVASHLTCVGCSRDELREFLRDAESRGIDYIVALRGDPPRGETEFRRVADGLTYANELVTLIRAEFPWFGIAVAGYPETHQEAASADADLANLKRKVDAGADVVITQLFYDNATFLRFRDRCRAGGIGVPIVPGILPVTNLKQIQRITSLCGACLPDEFVSDLSAYGEDDKGQFQVGVDFAVRQVQQLIDEGAPGVHFYVLNKSQATATLLGRVTRPV
jgi:methylenetetrahydrofolate reductase (NADPH)